MPTPDLSDLSKKKFRRFTDGGTDIEEMMKTKGEEVVPWSNVRKAARHGMSHRCMAYIPPDLESHFAYVARFSSSCPMR